MLSLLLLLQTTIMLFMTLFSIIYSTFVTNKQGGETGRSSLFSVLLTTLTMQRHAFSQELKLETKPQECIHRT